VLFFFQSFPVVFPFLYCVLPFIDFHNYSSLTTPRQSSRRGTVHVKHVKDGAYTTVGQTQDDKSPNPDEVNLKPKIKAVDRVRYYFTAPVTKFHYSMVGIIIIIIITVIKDVLIKVTLSCQRQCRGTAQ